MSTFSMLDIQYEFVQQMSTLLVRYWTFNMSLFKQMSTLLFRYWTFNMSLLSKCQLCYFDIGHSIWVLYSKCQLCYFDILQQMSTLLVRYWTFNMSLYSKCQLCYFDIGHSIWVCTANVNLAISILDIQYEFLQQMSTLLFRYWTFNVIFCSKCQTCYFVIGHSIWVCTANGNFAMSTLDIQYEFVQCFQYHPATSAYYNINYNLNVNPTISHGSITFC